MEALLGYEIWYTVGAAHWKEHALLLSLALLSLQNQNEVTDGFLYSAGVETKRYYRENYNLIYCVSIFLNKSNYFVICHTVFLVCDLLILYCDSQLWLVFGFFCVSACAEHCDRNF